MIVQFVQMQPTQLSGSGANIADTSVIVASLTDPNGNKITTADIGGAKGFGTLEPGAGTQEESIVFTGITQNGDGTATLTGVSTTLFKTPYTETSGLAKAHAGGSTFVISNTAPFYNWLVTTHGYWEAPVSTISALPTGQNAGETRITLDTYNVYIWNGSSWHVFGGMPMVSNTDYFRNTDSIGSDNKTFTPSIAPATHNNVSVFVNGLLLAEGSSADYQLIGVNIVLSSAISASDLVIIKVMQ